MIEIQMGGDDVVLVIQWLQPLRIVDFKFWELFIRFSLKGKEIKLKGMQGKPYKVMSFNNMIKLLKRGHP